MAQKPLTPEQLQEVADAYLACGKSWNKAAQRVGIPRATFQNRLQRAATLGYLPTDPVMPGFEIKQTSAQVDKDGQVQKQWIQQRPQSGEAFELPEGHRIKGVSALVGPNNEVRAQWIKTTNDNQRIVEDALKAAFEAYSAPAALPEPKTANSEDLLVVYPLADLHLGMYAWGDETGTDYDLDIAGNLVRSTMADLVARSSPAKQAIVLDVGDYFHADNSRNQTAKSGHVLDVDTRYAKVIQIGFELMIETIELALQKHDSVIYRKLPGNHDEETSLMLAVAVKAHFRNNPRVSVATEASRFFVHKFGKCLVAGTHGDMLRMGDLAGFVAAQFPEDWGRTVFRYGYTGHVHNERALNTSTLRGLRAESFNTLAGKDGWHAAMGYQAPRNMVSITLHRDRGEISRLTCPV